MAQKQIYILSGEYSSLASTGLTFSSAAEVEKFLNDCGVEVDDPLDAVRMIRDGEKVTAPPYKK